MPLYEYECDVCGHRFEKIVKFSDPPLETCPECGGPIHKLISSPAFQLKGTGWYVTDYAKKDAGSDKTEGGTKDADSAKTDAQAGKSDTSDKTENTDKTKRTDASESSPKSEKAEKPVKDASTAGGGSSRTTPAPGSTSKP